MILTIPSIRVNKFSEKFISNVCLQILKKNRQIVLTHFVSIANYHYYVESHWTISDEENQLFVLAGTGVRRRGGQSSKNHSNKSRQDAGHSVQVVNATGVVKLDRSLQGRLETDEQQMHTFGFMFEGLQGSRSSTFEFRKPQVISFGILSDCPVNVLRSVVWVNLLCTPITSSQGWIQVWAIGVIAPPKTYESNLFHHDFVQFGKQHSRH